MSGLDNIIGNEHIVTHFKKAIEYGKISHAYIINGERGMGKRTIARAFAGTLLCEEGGTVPCGKCHSCVQWASDNNPDIIYIEPDKPTTLSIDHIRTTLVNDIEIKPYSYKYKIYIINNAELMNNAAQNAILKTIEEPPEYAIIMLLTTNASGLLQTVLSRCVKLDMQPLKRDVVKKYLMEKERIVDYQADVAVSFAGGNLGKAKDLATSAEFAGMLEEVVNLLKYIKEMQAYEVVAAVKRANNYKFQFSDYIDLMMMWFRDVLMYKASQNVDDLIFKSEISTIKKHAQSSSYNGIENILKAMEKAKTRLSANVNFDIAIEMMFLTIRENI